MKFFATLATLALAGLAAAQSANFGLPAENVELKAGSETIVQIQRPNTLTSSTEIGVAIGLSTLDEPADEVFGTVLHTGPFEPKYHESRSPPYQNFTVTIPEGTKKGKAHLTIAHATLIGAGPYPDLQTLNRTVTIV
ncbi:hypothetical protein N7468_010023 [Penicillium chermesinum]|uniref:Uncharacterized protein n=1 Tax=Penicillium chermesinum TaxID=63820 RepID=A0A9W9NBW9_9EURO|nr:uncharacterized protein N7468_010023 [Penicillium chermesinum]KAJ5217015.1 hypothetical protein N7468_010023 [Penicillium chermesinum]